MSEDFAAPDAGYEPGGRDRRGQYRDERATDHSNPDVTQPIGRSPETTAELGLDRSGQYARDGRETARSQDIDQRMERLREQHGDDQQRRDGQQGRSERLVADEQRTEQPGRDTNDVSHPSNPQRLGINGMVADQEHSVNRQSNRLEERMAAATADPEKSNQQIATENLNELRGRQANGMGSDTKVQNEMQARAQTRGDLQGKIDAAQQRGRQQMDGRDGGQQTRQRDQADRRVREDRDRGERHNSHSHAR
ncbi:MAG: hypothetical protein GEV07_12755 [Streptosporangiales bacterium]|nr:hypothetical protein [Streptosporangiales bacterium]